jgi:two-component system phosphate regulon response regulator PhoB
MSKKILIVEDNEDALSFMKLLIEKYGYQVVEATDGIEALEKFRRHQPDLVLMDVSLPFVDGLTTAKAIREIEGSGEVPILVVTALGKSIQAQATEAGCNELIFKPIDIEVLRLLIEKHLESA